MTQAGLRMRVLALALCLASVQLCSTAVAGDDCWEAGDAEQKPSAKPPAQTQASPAPPSSAASPASPPPIAQYQPLTVGEKFKLGLRRGFGPGAVVSSLAVGGYQQARNSKPGFGQGAEGYFSRAGASYGVGVTRHMVGTFALASLFGQDPRYFPSDHKSRGKRLGYAISRVFVARGDNGRNQFNITTVGGTLAGGMISKYWYEPPDDTARQGFERAAVSLGVHAIRNIVREFFPGLGRKIGL